jgi:N-acetylneuraminate synthase
VITIAGRAIGPGNPAFIVAELSANHRHELGTALALVREARRAGADAIKLQTYTPDTMTLDVDSPVFRIAGGPWGGRTLYDLYAEAHMPWPWHVELKKAAEDEGLIWFSTPFDRSAVEFLETLDAPAYKIASFEAVDLPLLEAVARTGKPAILSTGMATTEEIAEAVGTLREHGRGGVALLKCTSAYPADARDMHLASIAWLRDAFGVDVGLSDHTRGSTAAVAAVALGACIVEKHFTLDRAGGGPDAAFSAEPGEFAELVARVREAEAAIGDSSAMPAVTAREQPNFAFRRSIFVVADMREGEVFTADTIRCIRPGLGLKPRFWRDVIGRRASQPIARGTPLTWDLVAGEHER